ncbi:hypothetical protein BH18ACT8_BH18ACT8_12190 [soil metagenome]
MRAMERRRAAALLVILCLATGCGSVGNPFSADEPTSTGREKPTSGPKQQRLGGADAVGELSDFDCSQRGNGRWKASGTITNSTTQTAGYAVTVVVSGSESTPASAKQRTVPAIPVGQPTRFTIWNVPVSAGTDPSCSVRVVRLP